MKTQWGELTVGFLGCGAMGGSIARALVTHGEMAPERVCLFDRAPERAEALSEVTGAVAVTSEASLVTSSQLIVLACKPRDIQAALSAIEWPAGDRTLVSVAAGVTTEQLRNMVPASVAVVRVMPNVSALVGEGVTGVLRHHDHEILAQVKALFMTCGEVVVLERESDFAALTAISGSGPAYFFVAMEALADGGVMMGLSRQMSLKLAMHTLKGAAALALADGAHPAELKDRVASPGGTTIRALAALEANGFRHALIEAVKAAAERSREMGASSGGG